jgi:hypothetical protein
MQIYLQLLRFLTCALLLAITWYILFAAVYIPYVTSDY